MYCLIRCSCFFVPDYVRFVFFTTFMFGFCNDCPAFFFVRFRLRLIAPSRTAILLKESGSSECADLRCEFTEINSCHSCTRPKETLSAFVGESALGTWMVAFEDKEGRKRSGLMAWAALKITWSCEAPIPTQ